MSEKLIADRYAVALYSAVKNDDLDRLFEDSKKLNSILKSSDELLSTLKSPLIKNELKLSILSTLIKDLTSFDIINGLLQTLFQNKRLSILNLVLSSFSEVLLSKR